MNWRVIGGLTLVAVFGFFYLKSGAIYDYLDTVDGVHLPEVDALVCLAGGRGRIAAAGDVWARYREKGKGPVFFLSGMGPQSTPISVKAQLRSGVRDLVRPEDLVIERESGNTLENAEFFLRYARGKGWKRVLLMTSRYHMRRARFIFEEASRRSQVPVEFATLSVIQDPFEPGEWRVSAHGVRVTFEEYVKWLYYTTVWRP